MHEALLVAALAGTISAPHLLPLRAVRPALAASVWFGALALRALVAVGSALFLLVYLPQTELFRAIAGRCLHAVVPVLATHLGLSGHHLADAALILPSLALAGSLIAVGYGLARAALVLRARLRRRALGAGPGGSTVVAEPGIVVAVTGVGRATIMVSREALAELDQEELDASLAHELGHVKRRHRPLLVASSLMAALARWLPGTRAARREFALSLERDADAFAVSVTHAPLALASAICKATPHAARAAVAGLEGRGPLSARLDPLLEPARPRVAVERLAHGLVAAFLIQVVMLAVTLPAWALAAPPGTGLAEVADCAR